MYKKRTIMSPVYASSKHCTTELACPLPAYCLRHMRTLCPSLTRHSLRVHLPQAAFHSTHVPHRAFLSAFLRSSSIIPPPYNSASSLFPSTQPPSPTSGPTLAICHYHSSHRIVDQTLKLAATQRAISPVLSPHSHHHFPHHRLSIRI